MEPELEKRIYHLEQLLAQLVKSDRYIIGKSMQFNDGRNIQLGVATGTKIGTATSQKLGFFNATPVIQQVANARDGFSIGVGSTVHFDSTFPSGAGGTKYTIGDVVASLQNLGLLAT